MELETGSLQVERARAVEERAVAAMAVVEQGVVMVAATVEGAEVG